MPREFEQIEWGDEIEDDCRQLVRLAVREDLDRYFDWTTASLVEHGVVGRADIVARESGVLAGMPVARTVIEEMAPGLGWKPAVEDGSPLEQGAIVATIEGLARDLLTCERIVLNFLGRLSGIATLTRSYVDAIAGTKAQVYDTRKTTPGWRRLEKYAVRQGGGMNHRAGLYAAVLIKDNHLALGASAGKRFTPAEAVARSRKFVSDNKVGEMLIEVEVDTLEQLAGVLSAAPDLVLLDNMPPDVLRQAVTKRDAHAPGVRLEASGGINLDTISAIAATGVDRISVGALTHGARSLDIGLDWKA